MKALIKFIGKTIIYGILFLNLFIASAGNVFGKDANQSGKDYLFGMTILLAFFFRKEILKLPRYIFK